MAPDQANTVYRIWYHLRNLLEWTLRLLYYFHVWKDVVSIRRQLPFEVRVPARYCPHMIQRTCQAKASGQSRCWELIVSNLKFPLSTGETPFELLCMCICTQETVCLTYIASMYSYGIFAIGLLFIIFAFYSIFVSCNSPYQHSLWLVTMGIMEVGGRSY